MATIPKELQQEPAEVVPNDPEQFHRFVEVARELGIEEADEHYEYAVDLILPPWKTDEPAEREADRKRTGRKKNRLF